MTNTQVGGAPGGANLGRSAAALGFGGIGLWLVAVYWLTIGLAVMILSAQQFNQKVAAAAAANPSAALTIGELISARQEYRARQDEISILEGERKRKTVALLKIQGESYTATSAEEAAKASMLFAAKKFVESVRRLSNVPPQDASDVSWARAQSQQDGDTKKLDAAYELEEKNWRDADIVAKSLFNLLEAMQRDNNKLAKDLENKSGDLKKFLGAFRGVSPSNANSPLPNATANKVGLLYELDSFQNLGFFWLWQVDPLKFVTLPGSVLTLVLALSMGALGSTLFVTSTFFGAGSSHTAAWYFFRPFLGMITALAVFIAFKAGQISISGGPANTGSDAELNPFLISFFAVIAGLLSEHAILRLSAVGRGWLDNMGQGQGQQQNQPPGAPAPEGKPLFAKDWASKFTDGKSSEGLVEALHADPARVEAWMARQEAVPPDVVSNVVKYFGLSQDELFDYGD